MKVMVDASTCVGCGLCEQSCPEVFKVQDDSIAHVLGSSCSASHNLREVADNCPVSCIQIQPA